MLKDVIYINLAEVPIFPPVVFKLCWKTKLLLMFSVGDISCVSLSIMKHKYIKFYVINKHV